jgi:hypothetical protein
VIFAAPGRTSSERGARDSRYKWAINRNQAQIISSPILKRDIVRS